MDGRVLAVVGAKGGVGKTTTSLNLAAALAEDGRAVAVVEADLAMANAVDFLDIRVNGGRTLHDVLAGGAGVTDATYPAPGGFDVVPSGVTLDGFVDSDLDRFPAAMDALKARYDAVLVDTAAGVSSETVVPMSGADASVLVSTPRVASIRDADKTITVADRADAPVGGVVLTKSGTGRSPPADRIASFLDTELLGHVPHDESIPKAQDAGQPAISYRPHSAAADAYREVAAALRKRPDMLGMTVTTNAGGFRFGDGDDGTDAFADGGDDGGDAHDDGFTNPFG